MKDWRDDCLVRLMAAKSSVDAVVRELASIVETLGFEYCSYVMRIPFPLGSPLVIWSSTYPQPWLDHYFSHNYLDIDPLLKRASRDLSPIVWSDQSFASQPAFWEEARFHEIKHGWALNTHGKFGTAGILSLARSQQMVTEAELVNTEMKLVWLSNVVHGLISSVEMDKLWPEHAPKQELTLREREVLRWTAAGKTADEVGTILGISERTVTFHISSSLVKLNAVNKTQAVAKALLLDYL